MAAEDMPTNGPVHEDGTWLRGMSLDALAAAQSQALQVAHAAISVVGGCF